MKTLSALVLCVLLGARIHARPHGPPAPPRIEARAPRSSPPGPTIDFLVRDDGLFTIDGETYATDDDTRARIEGLVARRPGAGYRVIASDVTMHGRLVRALELLAAARVPFEGVSVLRIPS